MPGIKRTPADAAFSDCVRERTDYHCENCGKYTPEGRSRQGFDCAHIYGRRHKILRWHPDNAFALCRGCHNYFGENPIEFAAFTVRKLGDGLVDHLRERKREQYKLGKGEEKEIAKHYREQLAIMRKKRANGKTGRIEFQSWY